MAPHFSSANINGVVVILPDTPTASIVNMPAPGHLAIALVALGGLVANVLVISKLSLIHISEPTRPY